jgi:hypothetical protein
MKLALFYTNSKWQKQVVRGIKEAGIPLINVEEKPLIWLFWNRRKLVFISFVDKPLKVLLLRPWFQIHILIEEGVGLYVGKKVPRSKIAKMAAIAKTLLCVFLYRRKIDFFVEQGKANISNFILLRSPPVHKDLLASMNTENNCKYVPFSEFPRRHQQNKLKEKKIFWGCDFEALNCKKDEKKAYEILKKIIPDLIYVKHPKISIVDFVDDNLLVTELSDDFGWIETQASFSSGALVDGKYHSDNKLLILPAASPLTGLLSKLGSLNAVNQDIYQFSFGKAEGNITLPEALECLLLRLE